MEDFELIDMREEDGLTDKQQYELDRLRTVVGRIVEEKADLTYSMGPEWIKVGMCFAIYGETARDLFHKISQVHPDYDKERTDEKYGWCISKTKYKSLSLFWNLCKQNHIDITPSNIENLDPVHFLPAEAESESANDIKEYGFFTMNNRYYRMVANTSGYDYVPFTNFVMKIKFHIPDKKNPRRIIEFKNNVGVSITIDTQTQNLGSTQKFTDFAEGLGNFHFEGTKTDLTRLKRKLFGEEKTCVQLDVLGWDYDGFFAFSNGVYNGTTFIPCDNDGIVEQKSYNYYIPAGNRLFEKDRFAYANEKKFRHITDSNINFEAWSRQFCEVSPKHAMSAIVFSIACMFSDVVFNTMNGFPILFLYGEGSSGKGDLARNVQRLWGLPQDPLKISEKANTDKAKIREMAQFRNGMCVLEEYTNDLDGKSENTLKGLWDRFGYKRAIMDSKFGNESVPINSGIIMTGNEYPMSDPLLQRLIVDEMNDNKFSQSQKDTYKDFKDKVEKGITSVTLEMMQHRGMFEENYKENFHKCYSELSAMLSVLSTTDRMISNVTALAATYKTMQDVLKFPFTYSDFTLRLKDMMEKQCNKRNTGGVVQEFWDMVVHLVKTKEIKHNREFKIVNDKVQIRFKEIFPLYAMAMVKLRRTPPGQSTLLDKLKLSGAFLKPNDSVRFEGEKSSCHEFAYDKIGADIWHSINYLREEEEERRKRMELQSPAAATHVEKLEPVEELDDKPF